MNSELDVYTAVIAISDPGACVAARHLVVQHERFETVREVTNAVMAIDACEILKPDLLLIAEDSPGLRGSEVLGEIRHVSPYTQVILLATYDATYLHNSEHAFVSASLSVPDSISDALDSVSEALDDPTHESVPERRRADRRIKQDWTKVFAERRTSVGRRTEEFH
ncbi:MAG: response regulator transcription factor [Acidimicrobiales bacterium]|nr:response regulator transcription factor [Acidimicrobiales bacterium]